MVTIRSPFCGYNRNTTYCVEVNGEDLSCCSNKIESVCLRKCLHDHRLTNKAYLHAITVTTFLRVFTYKMAAKINWHRYRTKLRHSHPTHTDSERPNRCCHLPSKAENIDRTPNISYTLQWAGRCPPTNLGNRRPNTWFIGPTCESASQTAPRSVHPFL